MQNNPAPEAGWRVAEWCPAAGIGRTAYYGLDPQPYFVKIGTARIITESPAAFLRRYVKTQRAKAAP